MSQLVVPPRVRSAQRFLRRYEFAVAFSVVLASLAGLGALFALRATPVVSSLICMGLVGGGIGLPFAVWEARARKARRLLRAWQLVQGRKDAVLLAVEARMAVNERNRAA